MSSENISGYWLRKNNINIDDEILMIDKSGRFVSKIPDDRKSKILGGWQRYWIKIITENIDRYAVSMRPDFYDYWEINIFILDGQLKILRDGNLVGSYNRVHSDDIPMNYLKTEEKIIRKMKYIEGET